MATFCPHCDEEIEDAIMKEWFGDYWITKDDFFCSKCHKEMEIDVEMEPNFIAHKKEA